MTLLSLANPALKSSDSGPQAGTRLRDDTGMEMELLGSSTRLSLSSTLSPQRIAQVIVPVPTVYAGRCLGPSPRPSAELRRKERKRESVGSGGGGGEEEEEEEEDDD